MKLLASLFAVVLLTAGAVHANDRQNHEKQSKRVALPVVKIENGTSCVAPVEEMRRDHMSMLFHQRDRTMRQGVREPRFSLKGCVECHASRETQSVLGKDGFCSSCHSFASVKMDCFECHTHLRSKKTAARP
jgi:hypothetical protein